MKHLLFESKISTDIYSFLYCASLCPKYENFTETFWMGDNRVRGIERKMEGLWIGRMRCCRGSICFSLTDGNSERKWITLPSHISTCVYDATRAASKWASEFLCPSVFLPARAVKRLSALACDCSGSFTRYLPVSISFPHMSVCLFLSCFM